VPLPTQTSAALNALKAIAIVGVVGIALVEFGPPLARGLGRATGST
jgi:hypothetical protein